MKINTYNPALFAAFKGWKASLPGLVLACGLALSSCSSNNPESGTADDAAVAARIEAAKAAAAAEANAGADGKGIGPVKEVQLAALDPAMADAGKHLFEGKCSACHQLTAQKVVGPGLKDITTRRKPEWIMNMIINPEEMTKKDPTGQELLAEHLTQMTNQNVTEEDARKLLEFFRQNDGTTETASVK